jgi:protein-S-isoprenylcysteine O-methyltransferase Ste14
MTVPPVANAAPPVAGAALPRRLLLLDGAERLFVAAVFAHFVWVMLAFTSVTVQTVLLVVGETLPFVYVMLRAPSAHLSQRPSDWAFGAAGTVAPLLAAPAADAVPLAPLALCLALMTAGLATQVAAKLVLGRSFGIVAANRGVKVAGPYRLVRHPMYAGYTLTHVGYLLAVPTWRNAIVYTLALACQVVRVVREERVLGEDAGYRAFAARVRYRLLPGVF